ncbi:aldo-keto reductase family protein [Methanobacterium paludis]|uniref:Uncharacterized protein n=1 Tax=Methanobacterium paludis (strain DSM 25820 / JCM 18151 / SWAN1) TaxID=868131 RepID=F6D6T0_METPW|nr:hypothetical protein [Methanobacterium paludis]AEG18968.1 hypothetical protein MSWAN_1959 [Methanobacterium paludis]
MFKGTIELNGHEVPRTLLGTSPFMGIKAAQFGHRSMLYQLDFYDKPEKILQLIEKSYELGIRGIQLVPYPYIVEAFKWAADEGCEMEIIGTVRPDNELEDIKVLSELEARAILLHGVVTDKTDWNFLEDKLQLIKDQNISAGLATHMPFRTTAALLESSVTDLFDIYLIPVNKLGYLMDCDGFRTENRAQIRDMIKKLDKTVIASKTLAAGILTPNEAFDYLKTLDYVDIVAVGIASEEEAEETFSILASK